MITLEQNIGSYESAERFVKLCETNFEKELDSTIHSVLNENNRIITLTGPTCSGKTTSARKLINTIEQKGYNANVISIDDFYRDNIREDLTCTDWDSAASLDLKSFDEFIVPLLQGKKATKPVFDLQKGRVNKYEEYIFGEKDIFIFEGIQAVYPEITKHFEGHEYSSIFVSVSEDVSVNGVFFDKHEIRLIRRLVRDVQFRNTSFELTFKIWKTVRENEETNIYPNIASIKHRINTFLPYELFIIGKYLISMAEKAGGGFYGDEILQSLVDKLRSTTSEYVTEEMISQNSVFREFIG